MKLLLVAFLLFGLFVFYKLSKKRSDCTVLQTIALDDANVEIVNADCKEGLPHTTDARTIRMTRKVWDSPRRELVLRHERIHLLQKGRSAAEWRAFYKDTWGYECKRDPPSGIPAEFIARLRPNPDTADSPWAVWRDRWVFFPAFGTSNSLRAAEVIVWDLENHRQVDIPDNWRNAFCGGGGCPHQYEHPHEITAEWLSATERPKTPAASQLFAWHK